MKHRRKAFWIAAEALALLCGCWLTASVAAAAPLNRYDRVQTEHGPLIDFRDVDYAFWDGARPPVAGWQRAPAPMIFRVVPMGWRVGDNHRLWGRYRFDRAALGPGPLALYAVDNRGQFAMFVNGREVFRNHARSTDRKLSWYRPFLIPLAADALRPGINTVTIRADSTESVAVGQMVIGPNTVLQRHYNQRYFWRITAPMLANFAMLVLGLMAFLTWLARRRETELLYLSLVTFLAFARNYLFFGETVPFDPALFFAISLYSTYFAAAAATAFYLSFLKLAHRQWWIAGIFGFGIPLVCAHWWFGLPDSLLFVCSSFVALIMLVLGLADLSRTRSIEHVILSAVMVAVPLTALYDVMLYRGERQWDSADFYLSVFNGFFYCLAFLASFGKRALDAFRDIALANQTLAQRIAETRAELAASEAARRQLIVGQAVAGERDRLMQEIHDGIGSNLITALAVAEQQQQPDSTLKTLRRAIADLKITVDSLEPVEGDIVALIGNLRHRMARDLADAGLTCKWEVQPCGTLAWPDATNALHVLRIFQEAIGNVLMHAAASEIRIGCHDETRGGVPGISAFVADNGHGLVASEPARSGKGLANIRARAASLHGMLDCDAVPGTGTRITLWLPYARATGDAA